jgi:hypothetical protein
MSEMIYVIWKHQSNHDKIIIYQCIIINRLLMRKSNEWQEAMGNDFFWRMWPKERLFFKNKYNTRSHTKRTHFSLSFLFYHKNEKRYFLSVLVFFCWTFSFGLNCYTNQSWLRVVSDVTISTLPRGSSEFYYYIP